MLTRGNSPWLLGIVAWIIVVGGCNSTGRAGPAEAPVPGDDAVLASVGDRIITASGLRRYILSKHFGRIGLVELIRETLFEQEAQRLGVRVDAARIEEAVDQVYARFPRPGVTEVQRRQTLAEWNLNEESIRRGFRQQARIRLLQDEVARAMRKVTDEDVQALYERTFSEEQVKIRHIYVEVAPVGPSDEARAMVEALVRARKLRDQALETGDFAAVAREHSEHRVTRPRGGDIGWIHRDAFSDAEFVEKIFALEVGVISDPILEGRSGYHVMEVMEREEPRPLAEVAPRLRDQLESAEATRPEVELSAKLIKERTRITIFDDALGE